MQRPDGTPFVARPADVLATLPVGGKARALARLSNAGLPVPDWFVVLPAAFDASVASTTVVDPAALATSPAVAAAIAAALPDDPVARYAVRSSASDEDGTRHSFAGQLESFLGVPSAGVPAAVARVWASAFGARLAHYRVQAGLQASALAPGVIVQRMIEGETSGVAFSADPVSGRRAIAVVAAVRGRGDALVSGAAEGLAWRVDREGRIVERPVAAESVPIDDDGVREIAALARHAERLFEAPQDVEWTRAEGRLWLLQSRPVTTLAHRADPDARRAVWDNANIVESYSGITTPMTFSFARRCYEQVYREFCRLVGVPLGVIEAHGDIFACMLGLIRGRVYYNLLNWYRLLALLPGYDVNRRFMEQMMGVRERLPESAASAARAGTRQRMRGAWALATTLVTFAWRIATLPRRMRRFEARLQDALGHGRPDLSLQRADELAAYYRELEGRLLVHWDAPIVNDFATMIFHGLLRKLCTGALGDDGAGLANDLIAGEGGMVSEEPAQRVRDLADRAAADPSLVGLLAEGALLDIAQALSERPALQDAFASYVDRFGERCLDELKLESPTLHDDPTPLYRAVAGYVRARAAGAHSPPAGETVRALAERRARDVLRRRPLKRLVFDWVLRRARAHVRARENLRFQRTRVFGRARQIVVEIGRRLAAVDALDAPRDVFWLEFDEMLAFVENRATTSDLKGLAALRRAEFAAFAALPAPAERFETHGIIHRGHGFQAERPSAPPEGDTLKGIACCPGVVRGRVRVVRDPAQARIQPGEILVAERTDPGWVMIFPSAAGLLVERGSLLSHSAIVARELGLPTIVSLPGVTRWLHDGDRIEMDGGRGTVVRLAQAESRTAAALAHGGDDGR